MTDNNENMEIIMVREYPLTLLLTLPDGCTPGRWEAAVVFAGNIRKIQEHYPGKVFQFLPFSYITTEPGKDSALNAMLAIAN